MNKLDKAVISMKNYGHLKTQSFMEKLKLKKNGDENLVVKIMLMVIAVFLVIIFRNTLKTIIETLLAQVQTKIESMYNSTP